MEWMRSKLEIKEKTDLHVLGSVFREEGLVCGGGSLSLSGLLLECKTAAADDLVDDHDDEADDAEDAEDDGSDGACADGVFVLLDLDGVEADGHGGDGVCVGVPGDTAISGDVEVDVVGVGFLEIAEVEGVVEEETGLGVVVGDGGRREGGEDVFGFIIVSLLASGGEGAGELGGVVEFCDDVVGERGRHVLGEGDREEGLVREEIGTRELDSVHSGVDTHLHHGDVDFDVLRVGDVALGSSFIISEVVLAGVVAEEDWGVGGVRGVDEELGVLAADIEGGRDRAREGEVAVECASLYKHVHVVLRGQGTVGVLGEGAVRDADDCGVVVGEGRGGGGELSSTACSDGTTAGFSGVGVFTLGVVSGFAGVGGEGDVLDDVGRFILVGVGGGGGGGEVEGGEVGGGAFEDLLDGDTTTDLCCSVVREGGVREVEVAGVFRYV